MTENGAIPTETKRYTVGTRKPRFDAPDKVSGKTVFVSDISLPNMLTGWVIPSPVPHGILKSIDVSPATALPGVHAVLTSDDVPGVNRVQFEIEDQEYIVSTRIRSSGDAICILAADNQQIASYASSLIRTEIETLPVIDNPDDAMKSSAFPIHENGNIARHLEIRRGDIEAGFRESDAIVENTYTTPFIEHSYLEPEAAVAYLDDENVLNVFVGCHGVFSEQENLAYALGLPTSRIRVVMPPVGGSFGGKDDHLVSFYAGLLALKTNKPIKMVWSRAQSFKLSSKRHSTKIWMKTGATKEGYLKAFQTKMIYDTGAYSGWGPKIVTFAACQAAGPYQVPNVYIDAYAIYTNNLRASAMRGWGTPQVAFCWESQMDTLAIEIGMHPLVFRWLNAVDEGSIAVTGKELPESVGIKATIKKAADLYGIALP